MDGISQAGALGSATMNFVPSSSHPYPDQLVCIGVAYWLRLANCKEDLQPHKRINVQTERQLAGTALQTALMSVATNIPVQVLALVGDDNEGRELVRCLNMAGIDSTNLLIQPETSTGWATAIANGKQEHSYYLQDLPERCCMRSDDVSKLDSVCSQNTALFVDAVLSETALETIFSHKTNKRSFVSVQNQEQLAKVKPYLEAISHLWMVLSLDELGSIDQANGLMISIAKQHPHLAIECRVPELGNFSNLGNANNTDFTWKKDISFQEPWELEHKCAASVVNWLTQNKN